MCGTALIRRATCEFRRQYGGSPPAFGQIAVGQIALRALVRHGTAPDRLERLQELGVTIARVGLNSAPQVAPACSGASCVVSALQGLRGVIVEAQTVLLDAAINAHVPRFIPSDYSIDFTKFPPGENRNLDLRRECRRIRTRW